MLSKLCATVLTYQSVDSLIRSGSVVVDVQTSDDWTKYATTTFVRPSMCVQRSNQTKSLNSGAAVRADYAMTTTINTINADKAQNKNTDKQEIKHTACFCRVIY